VTAPEDLAVQQDTAPEDLAVQQETAPVEVGVAVVVMIRAR
jgi:hypothetical protein